MSITRRLAFRLALIALTPMASTGLAFAQAAHILVPADKLQWAPAPPALPLGAEISVLEGNPSEKGPVTVRLRFPANYSVPPHWHSMTERVTVLSGALNIGMGDTLNRQATQALAPSGFVSLPAKMPHYVWTASPTIVQISLEGPFDIFYVNPADDPQKQRSSQ